MQRLTLTLLFIISLLPCGRLSAQNYHVLKVDGNVCTINKNTKTKVRKQQILSASTKLDIPEHGQIVLIDSVGKKEYTISSRCRDMVKNLIDNDRATMKQLSKQYFKYIWKQMSLADNHIANNKKEQKTTTIYRDTGDAIIVTEDSTQTKETCDTLKNTTE